MKFKFHVIFSLFFILGSLHSFAQIGIGTKTPAPSAALEVTSSNNNKGILIPRITATQKDAIVSPAEGLLVYQTTAPIGFYYYSNTVWKLIVDQTELDNKLASAKTYVDDKIAAATIADADATTKGKIQLAGDLGGTAAAPTVPGLALKANTSNMTTALASKANTSDVTTALASKANISSLSTVATSGNYNDLANKPNIPSAYVMPKASASELGGVKVGANLSIDADGVLSAAASGNSASTLTGVVPVANGGTGSNNVAGIKSTLGLSGYNVAIGSEAGLTNPAVNAISVGAGAGRTTQGTQSVAVGYVAGSTNQGAYAVSVGTVAGQASQGANAVAVGFAAGQNGQGANSVAVGSYAGQSQAANSIALNATGASLNPSTTGFYVAPIRNASASNSLFYDSATKEITYGTAASSGAVNLATGVTGTLPVANGGTGQTTLTGVKNTLGLSSSKVAIGADAGLTSQGNDAIAIGYNAGVTNQGASSIAIGYLAGGTATQGGSSIAIGPISGGGGNQSVAIGLAAWTGANNATAVGTLAAAGQVNSSALGYQAVTTSPNTIQLGADGVTVAGSTAITNVRTSGSLTAGAVTYPNTNGTAGQVLTANNNGNASWTTVAGTLPTTVNTSANYNIVMATGSNAALVTGTGNGGNTATLNPYTGQMSVSGLTAQGYGVTSPIYASTPQSLTDGATIAWNPLNGLNASVTLGGNRTLNFSGSLIAGSYGTLVVTQDATGGRTLTLPSVANKVLGSTSTTTIALSTAPGAKDIVNFYYDGTNYFWNVGQGYGTAATVASSTANLATGVTGTLAVANGGTGATTKTTAFDALSPMTTAGDIIYGGTNGTGTRLAKGNNFSFLTLDNAGLPTWTNAIRATSGSTWNAAMGFSFIGGDWAKNTGMFSDNPDDGNAMLKFRITGNSKLTIDPNNVAVLANTASTSKTTGALTVAGGLGVDGNIYSNNLNASGTLTAGSVTYPNAHGTANQVLSTTGSGTLTWASPAAVRLNSDEFTATAAQTVFAFTTTSSNTSAIQTPLSKPYMYINGTRIKNSAYTWTSGSTVTYIPANNNSYVLVAGDRIQFDYAY